MDERAIELESLGKAHPDYPIIEALDRPFGLLDTQLEAFCQEHGFVLDIRPNRQPGRALRRKRPSESALGRSQQDIYLEPQWDWRYSKTKEKMLANLSTPERLPYVVGVATFYYPPRQKRLYRRGKIFGPGAFCILQESLSAILAESLAMLDSWPPPQVPPDDPTAVAPGWARTLV